MNGKILRVGGIGTGNVFNHAHIPAYAHLECIRLVACYDPNREAAERTRENYQSVLREVAAARGEPAPPDVDVAICRSPEEVLAQVDLVDICTPVRWHAYYAAMALERNVHAMTEKPMARTWWEARQVADVARRSKALFQLNDDNLFIPRYQALRNVIEAGLVGSVQSIWIARGHPGSERSAWFSQPLEAGGGAILDYGSHAVASTWFLAGYDKIPAQVRSLGIQKKARTRQIDGRLQQIEVDDDAHFKVRFVDPVTGDWITAIIEATWTWTDLGPTGSDVRGYIEVEGSTGTVAGYVDEHDRDWLRVRNRSFGERLIAVQSVTSERESFQAEIQNFCRCIERGVPSILNADVGEGIIRVLSSAQLSELRQRTSVSPEDLADFSAKTAGDAPDPWQAGDRIVTALMEPYRLSA